MSLESAKINSVLEWIGFNHNDDRKSIIENAFASFSEVQSLNNGDISTLAKDFSSRTATNGRINFGIRRIKRLQNFVHWVHDHKRTSTVPSIENMTAETFIQSLETSGLRAEVRKKMIEDSAASSKEATPGPLKSEQVWSEWLPKFTNYLSTILGIDGVPLSYVIRDNEEPDRVGPFANFNEQCISQAPLSGVAYEADRSSVHQHLISFTTGQPSENWIKPVLRFRDGRKSMKVLCSHFEGEGNSTRRIAEADRYRDNLHYKSERSLKFELFLNKSQKMFNIYQKYKEEMNDDAKIRFLFKKVQHPGLKGAVEAMKAKVATSPPNSVTYTMVTNHLMSAVAELPEYLSTSRNISGVVSGETSGNSSAILDDDGKIKTGHYPNWKELSQIDHQAVISERKKRGIRSSKGSGKSKPDRSKLQNRNNKYKRQIASLKKRLKESTGEDSEESQGDDDADAGDQFGGKRSKKAKKKASS